MLLSYGCTREVAKHERSVRVAIGGSRVSSSVQLKLNSTRWAVYHLFYNIIKREKLLILLTNSRGNDVSAVIYLCYGVCKSFFANSFLMKKSLQTRMYKKYGCVENSAYGFERASFCYNSPMGKSKWAIDQWERTLWLLLCYK